MPSIYFSLNVISLIIFLALSVNVLEFLVVRYIYLALDFESKLLSFKVFFNCCVKQTEEGLTITKISDAEHAIRIYTESLRSLGLDLTTAGEIVGILSDKELQVISDMEAMVKAKYEFEMPLSAETLQSLEIECGMKCYGTSLDPDSLLSDILEKVKNAL